jgi:hypothetical protein
MAHCTAKAKADAGKASTDPRFLDGHRDLDVPLPELEPELQFQTSAIGAAVAALFSSGIPNMVSMVARVL